MDYTSQPLHKFIDDLAARIPAPGGGSASALGGALGAAAAQMAAAFTTGKEKFKSVEAEALDMQRRLETLRALFLTLMEADGQAYAAYAAARALPTDAPARPGALAAAREAATAAPERRRRCRPRRSRSGRASTRLSRPRFASSAPTAKRSTS